MRRGLIEKEGKSQNDREAVRIKQRKICVSAGNRTQDHSVCASVTSSPSQFLNIVSPPVATRSHCGCYHNVMVVTIT